MENSQSKDVHGHISYHSNSRNNNSNKSTSPMFTRVTDKLTTENVLNGILCVPVKLRL